jgi:DNA repair exonuclease SbcCD ATPase subunit
MKKIDFKKIYAKNFLCFGEEGIDICFNKYGNIILVKGTNLDSCRKGEEERLSSNGSGKSSIPEVIVYGLFGKTIKNPKKIGHKEVMNLGASKNLCVEVYWDDYKVQRKRKPDTLRLWKSTDGNFDDSNELTQGGMPATQKMIEDIIGLNYQTFINIFVFTDDNGSSFLECDAAEKRNIVENLLSLEKYRSYLEISKQLQKDHVQALKNLHMESEYIKRNLQSCENNISSFDTQKKNWKQTKINEVKSMGSEIESAQKEVENLNNDKNVQVFEEAQREIPVLQEKLNKLNDSINNIEKDLEPLRKKIQENREEKQTKDLLKHDLNLKKKTYVQDAQKLTEVLAKIDKLEPGVVCNHCFGKVDPENYSEIKSKHLTEIKQIKTDYAEVDKNLKNLDAEMAVLETNITELMQAQKALNTSQTSYQTELRSISVKLDNLRSIKLPDNSIKKAGLEEKIKLLKQKSVQVLEELKNACPYDTMITAEKNKFDDLQVQEKNKAEEIISLQDLGNYYTFWTQAFGDAGIRKYVIDEIIPALNSNVNYWLQFLIDNKLEINFDNELNETINKYPDSKPMSYHILSNGQKRRINLALSQSFAHVMSLNTGRYPSLVFLDEVTTNIDPVGVEGIYNMICELSKEKQVVITTHDHDLLELLNGCQELHLVMKNGISSLEKK